MQLIKLTDFDIPNANDTDNPISGKSFSLQPGCACYIQADFYEDAHIFLKMLATLIYPTKGKYQFMDKNLDFSNYRKLLTIKKQIGYVSSHISLIHNRTVRENLFLSKSYYENSMDHKMDKNILKLCKELHLYDKLDFRPADLNLFESQTAILLREIIKHPKVFIIEYPEAFIGHVKYSKIYTILKTILDSNVSIIFLSNNSQLIKDLANKQVLLTNKKLYEKLSI